MITVMIILSLVFNPIATNINDAPKMPYTMVTREVSGVLDYHKEVRM